MRRLPLFPLDVVPFPGELIPLHIFEPRYRRMVARRLETSRRFGLIHPRLRFAIHDGLESGEPYHEAVVGKYDDRARPAAPARHAAAGLH